MKRGKRFRIRNKEIELGNEWKEIKKKKLRRQGVEKGQKVYKKG